MRLVPDEEVVCGYSPFVLPKDHPFTPICAMHDNLYVQEFKGFPIDSKAADQALLSGMLGVAEERKSLSLKMQAYLYYGLAVVFRKLFRS